MNFRLFPPTNPALQTRVVNGRTYTGTPGTPVTVPDFDGAQLQTNSWAFISISGPTSARPTTAPGLYSATPGLEFYDETLGALVKWDGQNWRNPVTGAVT